MLTITPPGTSLSNIKNYNRFYLHKGWFCPWEVFNVSFFAGRNRVNYVDQVLPIIDYLPQHWWGNSFSVMRGSLHNVDIQYHLPILSFHCSLRTTPSGNISCSIAVYSIRETGLAPRAKNYWEAEVCIAMLPLFLGNFKLLQLQYAFRPRTTDIQRGNSLHCTAENSIPIPNF